MDRELLKAIIHQRQSEGGTIGYEAELITALEEAWKDNDDLSDGIDGMIEDRCYFEKIAEKAEAELDEERQMRLYWKSEAARIASEKQKAEADRDEAFRIAGVARAEAERDKLAARVKELEDALKAYMLMTDAPPAIEAIARAALHPTEEATP